MQSSGCYAIVAAIFRNESSLIEELDFSVSQKIQRILCVYSTMVILKQNAIHQTNMKTFCEQNNVYD